MVAQHSGLKLTVQPIGQYLIQLNFKAFIRNQLTTQEFFILLTSCQIDFVKLRTGDYITELSHIQGSPGLLRKQQCCRIELPQLLQQPKATG